MKRFRPIDCLSMAYGLSLMAVIILALTGCWQTLTMMAVITVTVWAALIQRGTKGGDNGE